MCLLSSASCFFLTCLSQNPPLNHPQYCVQISGLPSVAATGRKLMTQEPFLIPGKHYYSDQQSDSNLLGLWQL